MNHVYLDRNAGNSVQRNEGFMEVMARKVSLKTARKLMMSPDQSGSNKDTTKNLPMTKMVNEVRFDCTIESKLGLVHQARMHWQSCLVAGRQFKKV